MILHCVYVPQLSYPFICWWTSRLFPCPGYYAAMNIGVHVRHIKIFSDFHFQKVSMHYLSCVFSGCGIITWHCVRNSTQALMYLLWMLFVKWGFDMLTLGNDWMIIRILRKIDSCSIHGSIWDDSIWDCSAVWYHVL